MKTRHLNDVSPAKIFGRPQRGQAWLGAEQVRALRFGLRAAAARETALLIGPRSCGKSTMLAEILERSPNSDYVLIRQAWQSGESLLTALLESMGISPMGIGIDDQRALLERQLEAARHRHRRSIVLGVDDAERLRPEVWRELARLRAIRLGDHAPCFLIVGREAAQASMGLLDKHGGRERIAVHRMRRPVLDDLVAYIEHRLEAANVSLRVFPKTARVLAAALSHRSFVRVNLVCQFALLLAKKRGLTEIGENLVFEAGRMVGHSRASRSDCAAAF